MSDRDLRRDYGPFLAALDATDDVFPVLSVLADCAEERGDESFAGFVRWCVDNGKHPAGHEISPRSFWLRSGYEYHLSHPFATLDECLTRAWRDSWASDFRSELYLRLYAAWTHLPPDERESLVASGRGVVS
jgi:hypothetical protein